ncbi:DNA-directed RNA polymerase III subunit RPC4 [Diutina catenulata]
MSNRLDSLKKPSLKFKPKVVARKSEMERAKDAPVKTESPPARGGFSGRGRGRGGARGGRNRYEGTHVVSSGPLSAGSVSLGGSSTMNKLGLTGDQVYNNGSEANEAPDFLEEGTNEIDMTRDSFDEPLFPVRAARDDVNAPSTEAAAAAGSKEGTPTPDEDSKSPSPLKSETPQLEVIQEKKKQLESKIIKVEEAAELDERSQMIEDHQKILDLLTSGTPEPFTMQLPALPDYAEGSEGQIGQIRLHQSGKITLDLGNDIIVDMTRGADVDFLQQLVKLDLAAASTGDEAVEMVDGDGRAVRGKLSSVSAVSGKVLGTPQW